MLKVGPMAIDLNRLVDGLIDKRYSGGQMAEILVCVFQAQDCEKKGAKK